MSNDDALAVPGSGAERGVRAVPVPDEEGREMIPCCEHCGCSTPRLGHDDTCAEGCNDAAVAGENEKARR